jgi:Uma2 family endonuclease
MATSHPTPAAPPEVDYPDGDGTPVAETPRHRDNLLWTVELLGFHFRDDPMTYVSGNMFVYYVPGNKWRHLAPDVFVVRGVANGERRVYLTWVEGKGPDLVIEMTSPSTRDEDLEHKFEIYRDTLKVREYFLYDPYGEYLEPPLRGYRLVEGQYVPIAPVAGRLPSEVTGLHLEPGDPLLRVYDPSTGRYVLNRVDAFLAAEAALRDAEAARRETEAALRDAEAARLQAEAARQQEAAARLQAEAEAERLRHELEELRRRVTGGGE